MQHDVQILWVAGEPWCDLTAVLSADAVSVVTWNGTTRLLDLPQRRQMRVPLTGGHLMVLDDAWQPLDDVTFASPCGVITLGGGRWHCTSRVLAVLSGLHPWWAASESGHTVLEGHAKHGAAPGHPAEVCPVHLCSNRV